MRLNPLPTVTHAAPGRDPHLDVLRGVAVIGVALSHYPFVSIKVFNIGGTGVFLFFALSGFLVSGLLLHPWVQGRPVRIGRFLGRRAFKIYPAFYAFLLATTPFVAYFGLRPFSGGRLLAEVLFYQSWSLRVWSHTWSLAVEEHFYLLIALLLYWATRGPINGPRAKWFIRLCTAWALGGILVRQLVIKVSPWLGSQYYFNSFAHFDHLFAGVCLAWLFYLHRPRFLAWLEGRQGIVFIVGIALWLIHELILSSGPYFFITQSITAPGFACIVAGWCLGEGRLGAQAARLIPVLYSAVARFGYYSYSLYLVHMLPIAIYWTWVKNNGGQHMALGWRLALLPVYFVVFTMLGIGLYRLVEGPALRLRDRLVGR